MDFGMPTLLEHNDIDECAALCKELDLQFIELNMNFPQYQTDRIDIKHYRAILEENQIYYTIHLEEELNVCGYNKEVTTAYINTVVKSIEIAKQLKAPILNMHMAEGIYITLPEEKVYLFGKYGDLYHQRLKEFRNICEGTIGDSGIRICIENSGGFSRYAKEGIEFLLESRVFALTYDIGHDHSHQGIDEPFIKQHKDKLIHMHVHDGIGSKNHLVLGTGEIDLVGKLALARECGCRAVLEVKTIEGLKQSVERRKNYNDSD